MAMQVHQLNLSKLVDASSVVLSTDIHRPRPSKIIAIPVRYKIPGLRFAGWIPEGSDRIVEALKSTDLVHIHFAREMFPIQIARRCRKEGIPYILQTHGMLTTFRESRRLPNWLLDRLVVRQLVHGAEAVLALQSVEASSLRRRFPHSKIKILPNGVVARDRIPDLASKKVVTFLARFHPRKRPVDLIQAFRSLPMAIRDGWTLRLVGSDDGELSAMRAAAQEDPSVRIEDAVPADKIWEIHAQTGIFVLPSVDEPFSMGVLEAISVGVCCVVTRGCHNADILEQSGAAIVCNIGPEGLADALRLLMSNPELRLKAGANAHLASREVFGQERVTEKLLEIYHEVLRSR